jgi:hypothetical protein
MRSVVVFSLVAVVLASSTTAHAHKRYARKLGVECKECHESPEGGGPRNLIGQYYQATAELPADRSPPMMKLVEGTVDRWLMEQLSQPPTVRWRHTTLAAAPESPPRTYTLAPDHAVLRRLSLDLRGTAPTEKELKALSSEQRTVDDYVDEFIASKDFDSTFFLYHKDIIRPRTGIFSTPPSFSRVSGGVVGARQVWRSERILTEAADGDCDGDKLVQVSPWWDRKKTLSVCRRSASPAETVTVAGKTLRCDTEAGQASGQCGCGKNLVHCYTDGLRDAVVKSMKDEMAQLAMTVVRENRPYTEVLTADWTMLDGNLEVFYGKVWETQSRLEDPDASRPWHKVERDPRHSGVISSPAMLNFFYNGRRWAERTLEAFFCHETTPDFDLLDDTVDAGDSVAVPYRDSPDLTPTMNVTQGRACAACHLQLDAVARVKDRWDFFGRYYEEMPTRHLPIPQEVIFNGAVVSGMDGFGRALANSETFHDCVVNQVWQHMTGHRFRPDELGTRRALVAGFEAENLNFKSLVKAVVQTPEYRSMENLKLMKREQYLRAMGRATDVAWKVGDKTGWDVYYDKVGGMDYRKIEARDVRPGVGHSLVQFKGAAESCGEFVTREEKRAQGERLWLSSVKSVDDEPSAAQLDDAMARLYLRAVSRPWSDVGEEERTILRELFADVEKKNGAANGWRAVCTAVFGSSDYALY